MLLEISYRYRGFDYLVADKAGNLYILPHFNYRRTVYFKKLNPFINGGKKGYQIQVDEYNDRIKELTAV